MEKHGPIKVYYYKSYPVILHASSHVFSVPLQEKDLGDIILSLLFMDQSIGIVKPSFWIFITAFGVVSVHFFALQKKC